MKKIRNKFNQLLLIKQARDGRRITQLEVAHKTGLSTSTVNFLARNMTTQYSEKTLEKLCDYFDCTPGDLLVYEEVDETPT